MNKIHKQQTWLGRIAYGSALGAVALLTACGSVQKSADRSTVPEVQPVPPSVRESLDLPPFYQKHVQLNGFPVLGSERVSDDAMREAAWILQQMMRHRPEILSAMASNRARLVVMAYNEYTTDIPEQADMKPKVFWDRRARGLGGRLTSCAEENLLCFPNDPYSTENILIHEFAHGIHQVGMRALDPTFNARLRSAYRQAVDADLWAGTYAGSDIHEYWAEGAQSWFGNNREDDAVHNHVNTRAELKEYDPVLAALCAEVFGDLPWRYQKPMERAATDRRHLTGFEPADSPRFEWRPTPITDEPEVRIETELGDITVELYSQQAPITVSNFLYYVLEGHYRDADFFRTVRADNQPEDSVKIEVIQAQANRARVEEFPAAIPLERTRDTGLTHRDGTLSMARSAPDSAQDSFSICIGDQPGLDFGGDRNPDGQGFAAFGRVIDGMDVVRSIHELPADGQQLIKVVRILNAYRMR